MYGKKALGRSACLAACFVLLFSCVTVPATRSSLDEAYSKGNIGYLDKVASGKTPSPDEKTKAYAASLYRQYRREAIKKAIVEAKAAGNAAALERMITESKDPWFEADLRALAKNALVELKRAEILRCIEDARVREDAATLRAIETDKANPYISTELRGKARTYANEIETRIAQRERLRRISEASQLIDAAFEKGDVDFLQAISAGKNPGDIDIPDDPLLRKKAAVLFAVTSDPSASLRRLRAASLDRRVREIHPMIANFISTSPEKYVGPLVEALTKDVYDPFEKTKLIHDWIADNVRYNFEGYCSGNLGDNGWAGVLKSGKSVCAGYANLFAKMCGLAGLKCTVVSGFAKGYGYDPLGSTAPKSNHAWNAVTIQGRMYLVDVTWDAGYINGFGQNVKSYSTEYLFADPSHLIYSHFPDDPRLQLLPVEKSFEEFISLPGLRGAFFDSGIEMLGQDLRGVMETSGPFELVAKCPAGMVLDAVLRTQDNRMVENACIVLLEGETARIRCSFPGSGPYTLTVFGGKADPRILDMQCLLEVIVMNHGDIVLPPAFPTFYNEYFADQCQLLSPLDGVLVKGCEYSFRLRVRKPGAHVKADVNGKTLPLALGPDGIYTATIIIPDSKELILFIGYGSGQYKGIVQYDVR